jgi:transcriptional regulator with XRE-family HTH domain
MTQRALAQEIDTDPMQVSRWERGEVQTPASESLAPLAEALGVTTDYLLGRAGLPAAERSTPPPHWAEFVERYRYIGEFNSQQLHDLQRFYDRHGKRPQSWTDWERLAEIVRTSQDSEIFEAATRDPVE